MQFTSHARCRQLLPMMEQLTGMAFAIEQADAGKTVLYVVSSARQARRMLGWDTRAQRFSQGNAGTQIYVADLKEKPQYLDYGAVVLDIVASPSARRDWWVRFIEEQVPRADLFIAFNVNEPAMRPQDFRIVRRDAVRTAREVNRSVAHAIGSDDQKLHAIRAKAAQTWDVLGFWYGLEEHDSQAELDRLKPSTNAIRRAADGVWVQEARGTKRIAELEAWAARPLTDDEVLQELKTYGLTMLRGAYEPTWIVKRQWDELHEPTEEPLRIAGVDIYAADRKDPASHLLHLHRLLGPRISTEVQAGRQVTVSGADTTAAAMEALVLYADQGERVRRILDPNRGSITKRMKPRAAPSTRPDDIRFIGGLLKRAGYRCVDSRRVRTGKKYRTVADFEPVVAKPTPDGRGGTPRGSTSSFSDFQRAARTAYIRGPLYRRISHPSKTAPKPALNGRGYPPEGGTMGGFSLDVDAWRALGAPPASSDGFDRATTYGVVPQFVKDGVLYIPDPSKRRAASDKEGRMYGWWPGTKAMVQAISKTHRSLLAALPGRKLLNFDFSAAHIRFAGKLAVNYDQRKQLQSVSEAADPYQALATPLAVTRADAKLILLKVLNGGRDVREHCPLDWDGPRYARFLKELGVLLQPWEKYCEALNLADPLQTKKGPTAPRQRGAFELQRVERRLCEYTLTQLKKTAPQLCLLATMYDGALLDMDQADSVPDAFLAVEAAAAFAAKKLGYPKIGVTMNVGQTWKEAEESR